MTIAARPASSQSPTEGTIRLIPAMSDVPGDAGPFTVFIVGEDLEHSGSICYDDDRDGTPERCVPSDGVAAFEVKVDYDPQILATGVVQSGPELSRSGRSFQCLPPDEEPGSITFGCLSPGGDVTGVAGTLTLASFEFIPRAGGVSPLALEAELAGPLGDSVSVSVGGGAARVTGLVPAPTPEATAPPAANGSATPIAATATGPGVLTGTPPAETVPPTTPHTPAPTNVAVGQTKNPDGGSLGSAALWSIIIGGTIGAGGLLVLGVLVLRQRQQRSHA
jgi:hypothetical protein